jgi:hypothetical protein
MSELIRDYGFFFMVACECARSRSSKKGPALLASPNGGPRKPLTLSHGVGFTLHAWDEMIYSSVKWPHAAG